MIGTMLKKFSPRKESIENIIKRKKTFSRCNSDKNRSETMKIITSNTEISREHMTPELKLMLLNSNCPLYSVAINSQDTRIDEKTRKTFEDPFWSIYWPGGQALTRFIFDEGWNIFKGFQTEEISVLDIGSGCGASAIAAKIIGAPKVLANDINQVACVAISMNARLNNVDIEISSENLLYHPMQEFHHIILVGDLFYDREITECLLPWLQDASKKGSKCFIGDPGRHGLMDHSKQQLLTLIRKYSLPENVKREHYGYHTASIWGFR